jgi:hypothetical protein
MYKDIRFETLPRFHAGPSYYEQQAVTVLQSRLHPIVRCGPRSDFGLLLSILATLPIHSLRTFLVDGSLYCRAHHLADVVEYLLKDTLPPNHPPTYEVQATTTEQAPVVLPVSSPSSLLRDLVVTAIHYGAPYRLNDMLRLDYMEEGIAFSEYLLKILHVNYFGRAGIIAEPVLPEELYGGLIKVDFTSSVVDPVLSRLLRVRTCSPLASESFVNLPDTTRHFLNNAGVVLYHHTHVHGDTYKFTATLHPSPARFATLPILDPNYIHLDVLTTDESIRSSLTTSTANRINVYKKLTNTMILDVSGLVFPPTLITSLMPYQKQVLVRLMSAITAPLLPMFTGVARAVDGTLHLVSKNSNPVNTHVSVERHQTLMALRGAIMAVETGGGKSLIALLLATMVTHPTRPNMLVVPALLFAQFVTEITKHGLSSPTTVLVATPDDVTAVGPTTRLVVLADNVLRSAKCLALAIVHYHVTLVDEAHNLRPDTIAFRALFSTRLRHDIVIPMSATPEKNFDGIKQMIGIHGICQSAGLTSTSTDVAFIRENLVYACRGDDCNEPTITVTPVRIAPPPELRDLHRLLDRFVPTAAIYRLLQGAVAGGMHDLELYAAIIKQLGRKKTGTDPTLLIVSEGPPDNYSFDMLGETCSLCLFPHAEPLQLSCGHVLCSVCLQAMLRIMRSRCPMCRTALGRLPICVSLPQFAPTESQRGSPFTEEKESKEPPGDDDRPKKRAKSAAFISVHEVKSGAQASQLLRGRKVVDSVENLVDLDGKFTSLQVILAAYVASPIVAKQLVLFTSFDQTATRYRTYIEEILQLTVTLAGVCGTRRKDSLSQHCRFSVWRGRGADCQLHLLHWMGSQYSFPPGSDRC